MQIMLFSVTIYLFILPILLQNEIKIYILEAGFSRSDSGLCFIIRKIKKEFLLKLPPL